MRWISPFPPRRAGTTIAWQKVMVGAALTALAAVAGAVPIVRVAGEHATLLVLVYGGTISILGGAAAAWLAAGAARAALSLAGGLALVAGGYLLVDEGAGFLAVFGLALPWLVAVDAASGIPDPDA